MAHLSTTINGHVEGFWPSLHQSSLEFTDSPLPQSNRTSGVFWPIHHNIQHANYIDSMKYDLIFLQ
jgi:hypothetical protein